MINQWVFVGRGRGVNEDGNLAPEAKKQVAFQAILFKDFFVRKSIICTSPALSCSRIADIMQSKFKLPGHPEVESILYPRSAGSSRESLLNWANCAAPAAPTLLVMTHEDYPTVLARAALNAMGCAALVDPQPLREGGFFGFHIVLRQFFSIDPKGDKTQYV